MALQEVTISTQQEYDAVDKHFTDLKQHILDCFEFEDFENLNPYDLRKVKELYFQRAGLFWQIKCESVAAEMETIKANNENYKHDIHYCELAIKKFEYYNNQVLNEFKAKNDLWTYNNRFKPIIENQIRNWRGMLKEQKLRENKIRNGLLVEVES